LLHAAGSFIELLYGWTAHAPERMRRLWTDGRPLGHWPETAFEEVSLVADFSARIRHVFRGTLKKWGTVFTRSTRAPSARCSASVRQYCRARMHGVGSLLPTPPRVSSLPARAMSLKSLPSSSAAQFIWRLSPAPQGSPRSPRGGGGHQLFVRRTAAIHLRLVAVRAHP